MIEAVRLRQQELGLPEKDESEETPRSKVADALRYLENQKSACTTTSTAVKGCRLRAATLNQPSSRSTGESKGPKILV